MIQVTFENICKMFASFEPGPALHDLDEWFRGMVAGLRAIPLYIPGTVNHHALKVPTLYTITAFF